MTATILQQLVEELQRSLALMKHPPAFATGAAIAPRAGGPTGGVGPFQRRLLEVPTTFGNEQDGTWLMADWDRDGIPDLIFLKTANTPSGRVEVHAASGKSNYQTRVLETATTFGNEQDGTWLMADWDRDGVPDLIFIKTANTPSGRVEVHVASGKSSYQNRVLEVATTFGNEQDGTWLMADWDRDGVPDLIFIKTANTPNGHVEVHVASGKSNYQTRVLEIATTFANEGDGTWLMADWDHDGIPDLVFVKTANTPSGNVEVHVASGRSNYSERIVEVATTFGNETDGAWLMADWDRDGIPDLIFVKTDHTPNGHVEVHVASGGTFARVLALAEEHQQQTEWCWSATTVSITKFYDPMTAWTQCSLVNKAFGQATCCQQGNSSACNQPWYPDKALAITGHLASSSNGAASLTQVENEINAGHPISIAIYWTGGGGHNPAIDGYDVTIPTEPMIDLQDPWYGHSTQDFNSFPSTYQGGASWGVTYFTK